MTLTQSVSTCLRKYATFYGRASRSEFWWFWLFYNVLFWGPSIVVAMVLPIDNPIAAVLFGTGSELPRVVKLICAAPFLLPMWAVGARRLHDIGMSGWWQLLYFFPCIGTIVLWVLFATDTNSEGDRFNVSKGLSLKPTTAFVGLGADSKTHLDQYHSASKQKIPWGCLLPLVVVIGIVGVMLFWG